MTSFKQQMQHALRERRMVVSLAGLWLLLTISAGFAGPFGTHDALTLLPRLAYWAIVVGVSVLSSMLPFMTRETGVLHRTLLWVAYTLALTCVVFPLNALFFEGWLRWDRLAMLFVNIGIIVCAVHVVLWLINYADPKTGKTQTDPQARFLRRLPLEIRAPLVRIEAQDHYLNVVTTKGNTLILMRLSEAVEELKDAPGLLVHRSHWIALQQVVSHHRENGRDLLEMSDRTKVPVSRSNRMAAKAAGLFATS